jgi:hypothetical protein
VRGEAGVWLKIAKATGTSPQRAKEEHTLSDFLDWQAHFEEETLATSKLDRQLARLTYYVYLVFMATLRQNTSKTEDDFLVRYERVGGDVKADNPKGDGRPAPAAPNPDKIARSKEIWKAFGASGVRGKDGKRRPFRRPPPGKKKGG